MNNIGEATRYSSKDQDMNDQHEIENFVSDDTDNCLVSSQLESPATYFPGAPRGQAPPGQKEGWTRSPMEAWQEPTSTSRQPRQLERLKIRPKCSGKRNTGTYTHHEMPA